MGQSANITLTTDRTNVEDERALYLAAADACSGSVIAVEAVWTAEACELRLTHADGRRSVRPITLTAPRFSFDPRGHDATR